LIAAKAASTLAGRAVPLTNIVMPAAAGIQRLLVQIEAMLQKRDSVRRMSGDGRQSKQKTSARLAPLR